MNKYLKLFGLICIISVILIVALKFISPKYLLSNNDLKVQVYFKNIITKSLDFEVRSIAESDQVLIIQNVLNAFFSSPKTKNFVRNSSDISIDSIKILEDSKLLVSYSKQNNNITEIDEIFFKTAFVYTFTGLPFINEVSFNSGDTEANNTSLSFLNRDNVLISPSISPYKTEQTQSVKLYFADETGNGLASEIRSININPDELLARYIIEALIYGPEGTYLTRLIPVQTVLREVKIDNSICYISLSYDFISKQVKNTNTEMLAVYSVVNSITELNDINAVQFLFDAENAGVELGNIDLSVPIERNESVILRP